MTLDPDTVTRKTFETGFRGYDPMEVQAYLVLVADELRAAEERELDLELRLGEAERRAREAQQRLRIPPPSPSVPPPTPPSLDEVDPDELVRLVGEETVRVLQSARAGAEELRVRAGIEADDLVASARAEAEVIHTQALAAADVVRSRAATDAEELAAHAQGEAAEVLANAEAEAEQLVSAAEAEAEQLVRAAAEDAGQLVDAAQQLRRQVLDDLADRRHRARIQLEQLRAGHEHLSQVLTQAQLAFQDVDSLVTGALDGARDAAVAARRQVEESGPMAVEGIEARLDAGGERDTAVVAALFARIRAGADVFEPIGTEDRVGAPAAGESGAVDPAPGAGLAR